MIGTGVSLLGASVPSVPMMLGPSFWLDEGYGVAETGSGLTSWTCKVTGKTAIPSPTGFAVQNGEIKSSFGQGMSFPPTQAQTVFSVMRVDGFPPQSPNSGNLSSVLGDSPSVPNDDYIFLSSGGAFEISLDGRVSRSGIYQRNGLSPLTGTNVGPGALPVNSTHSLLIRYPTVPNPWQILGAFLSSNSDVFGSESTWHQVMLFDRMLSDTEAAQLLNWANTRYALAS